MTLYWTLQKEEAWNHAKKIGYLEGQAKYAMYPEKYLWMMEQMKKTSSPLSGRVSDLALDQETGHEIHGSF